MQKRFLRFILIIMSFLSCALPGYAQYVLLGTATRMPGGCILLTPDVPYTEGIAYNQNKLDLNRYFRIEFDIYLGDKDSLGADGICFVIQDDPRGFHAYGPWGEGQGYGSFSAARGGGISPSVAVEFDTYQNPWQGDPPSDHVAFLTNGYSRHEHYWNNGDDHFNLEDDLLHSFGFIWDPADQSVRVMLDGATVYRGNIDLVKDIFNGHTQVIWGFTASTGRKYNRQYFCLKRLASVK